MLFGLACKGLHCAGCGKGIPLGIVIILLGIVSRISNAMVRELANSIMWGAFIIGGCIVATGAVITAIQRRDFQMIYTNWEGPTMVQEKAEETWTERAQVGMSNPFYEAGDDDVIGRELRP